MAICRITDILASIAAHAAVIGAVSVIRVAPSGNEERIEIPITFEIVEAADAASSPSSSAEVDVPSESNEPRESPDGESHPEDEPVEEDDDDASAYGNEAMEDECEAEYEDMVAEALTESPPSRQDSPPGSAPSQMMSAAPDDSAPLPPQPSSVKDADAPRRNEERAEIASDPVALNRIVPAYPRRARRLRHEGCVTLEIEVGADGSVSRAVVVMTSGHGELDAAAMSAVRTARFAPAAVGGASVSGRLRLTFEFRLK